MSHAEINFGVRHPAAFAATCFLKSQDIAVKTGRLLKVVNTVSGMKELGKHLSR